MEHKVFYGEYSLKHWIDLMLKGKIIIPEFQRSFVWEKEDAKDLMESFEDNSFVPPVMIGAYNEKSDTIDYVIDGQQRLSSILLAYLGKFPINSNKESDEEDDNFEWDFEKVQKLAGRLFENINDVISKMEEKLYSNFDYGKLNIKPLDDTFFKKYYLGFSYIKPHDKDPIKQKGFYASLFRNINMRGVSLSDMQARKALYWLDKDKVNFFNPNFVEKITVDKKPFDFARILALLSEYKKLGNSNEVAKKYHGKKNIDKYVVLYIKSVIEGKSDRFDINIPNDYVGKINNIEKYIEYNTYIAEEKKYASIINSDYKLLGLVYWVLFEDKNIDICNDKLQEEIEDKIKNNKSNNPNNLTPTRSRLKDSINIYKKFIKYDDNV